MDVKTCCSLALKLPLSPSLSFSLPLSLYLGSCQTTFLFTTSVVKEPAFFLPFSASLHSLSFFSQNTHTYTFHSRALSSQSLTPSSSHSLSLSLYVCLPLRHSAIICLTHFLSMPPHSTPPPLQPIHVNHLEPPTNT